MSYKIRMHINNEGKIGGTILDAIYDSFKDAMDDVNKWVKFMTDRYEEDRMSYTVEASNDSKNSYEKYSYMKSVTCNGAFTSFTIMESE